MNASNSNRATRVARANITDDRPAERSEEGLPIGNGRMGSLVWTTPDALRLQINRVDVFAVNRATNSFPERDLEENYTYFLYVMASCSRGPTRRASRGCSGRRTGTCGSGARPTGGPT